MVSSYLSLTLGGIIALLPIFNFAFTLINRNRIQDPEIKSRFGSFYESIKQHSLIHLMCTFFFSMRRLILVAAAVQLSEYPGLQVMIFIFMSKLNIIYIISSRPFENRATNLNEIFNEGCILLTSYTLFMFTDHVEDA